MGRDSFVFYLDWIDHLSALEATEVVAVLKAIQSYINGGEVADLPPAAAMAFKFIQAQVGRDMEKWDNTRKKRAEAGRKGALITNERQKAAKSANADFAEQETANSAVPVPVSVPVPDSVPDSVPVNVSVPNNVGNCKTDKPSRPRFSPPTVEAVRAYCQERGNTVDPERFVDYYAARGWLAGRNPMKDWRAAVRTWEKNNTKEGVKDVQNTTGDSQGNWNLPGATRL